MSDKREEYISWDGYFLGLAALASFRSKDPSTQNGACVVDPDSLSILAMGYNGFPRGCSDDEFPWARSGESKGQTKYPFVEHSERNAIFNAARKGVELEGSHIYIYSEKGYYPCDECARAIIQSGIKKVVMGWAIDTDTDVYSWDETWRMFKSADIEMEIISDLRSNSLNLISDFKLIGKQMKRISTKLEGLK